MTSAARRITYAFLTTSLSLVGVLLADGATQCDPSLPTSRTDPFGYRTRGSRCEGVYIQRVSATPLLISSFGRVHVPEPLKQNASLTVAWMPEPSEIHVRAYSLKSRTYYRMDHRQAGNAGSYQWPTDVLAALRLTSRDIGVIAFLDRKIGTATRLYVPVRVGNPPLGVAGVYELIVLPGDELKEVYVALSRVVAGKRTEISAAKPLHLGFYPAGRAIRIPIGPVAQPGTYLIEIGATLAEGGSVSEEVWFLEGSH